MAQNVCNTKYLTEGLWLAINIFPGERICICALIISHIFTRNPKHVIFRKILLLARKNTGHFLSALIINIFPVYLKMPSIKRLVMTDRDKCLEYSNLQQGNLEMVLMFLVFRFHGMVASYWVSRLPFLSIQYSDMTLLFICSYSVACGRRAHMEQTFIIYQVNVMWILNGINGGKWRQRKWCDSKPKYLGN